MRRNSSIPQPENNSTCVASIPGSFKRASSGWEMLSGKSRKLVEKQIRKPPRAIASNFGLLGRFSGFEHSKVAHIATRTPPSPCPLPVGEGRVRVLLHYDHFCPRK